MKKLKVILMLMKKTFPVTYIAGWVGLIILGLGIITDSIEAEWIGAGLFGSCVLIFWIIMHVNVSEDTCHSKRKFRRK